MTRTAPANLAREWVLRSGKSIEGTLSEYDGACIDFAGDFLDAIGRGRLAYFETGKNPRWKYHAAVVIDGMVHDLWQERPMSIPDYFEWIGATTWEYTT